MEGLSEKEMRLLVGIVLDRAEAERNVNYKEDSKEMENACEIVRLSGKLVAMCNKMYPVPDDEDNGESIFGI
jgi:hypothetical protein